MNLLHKLIATVVILGWIYFNLHIIFPFILSLSTKFNSFIHIVILLFTIGPLATMNNKIGIEYLKIFTEKYGNYEVQNLAGFLLIPCILLVGYSIIGAWFSIFDFGWEDLKMGWFNRIFFTIFCFSVLSIPSKISGVN